MICDNFRFASSYAKRCNDPSNVILALCDLRRYILAWLASYVCFELFRYRTAYLYLIVHTSRLSVYLLTCRYLFARLSASFDILVIRLQTFRALSSSYVSRS